MDYGIVVFSSVTIANKIKKTLKNELNGVSVVQIPSNLGIKGCNYALRCRYDDLGRVLEVSKQNKLKIKAVFHENTDSTAERRYTKI